MDDKIMFEKDSTMVKHRRHLQKNVFLHYSPKKLRIERASCKKIGTEIFALYRRKKRQKRKKRVEPQKRKRQTGGVLNRYDFTYAGREVVNEAAKVASGAIRGATNDINSIAKQRIDQIISQSGKEIEHVLPKVLIGAIEDVYQTPSRLLRNLGVQQLNKLKITKLN